MSRAVELVHQWTCGPLTPEEETELGALLAAGGPESQKALELLEIDAMLRGELLDLDVTASVVNEIQRHEADDAARRVLVKIAAKDEPSRPVPRPGRRRRTPTPGALAAVAATLLVIGGVTWTLVRPTEPRDRLTAEGTVRIETDEGFVEYDEADGLPIGKKIKTGENASTRVRLHDGSDVKIGSHTVLAFVREDAAVRVELSEGRVLANVAKQDLGERFAVHTPNLVVEVVGTKFSVSHEADVSTVNVEEGTVDVVFPGSGKQQRLAAGEELTASESGVPADPVREDWHENFEAPELAAWWTTGSRTSTSEAPGGNVSQGCLKAAEERDTYYERDLLVAHLEIRPDGLFRCDESLVVGFRYHGAPSCGWMGIWMQAASGKKYFVPVKATLGSWQSAEIRLQEARSSEGGNDAPMPSGEMIQMLKFQAGRTAADSAFYIDDLSINRRPPGTGR